MIETVDYDDYARERVGREGRVPLSGSLELTARCNLRCVHCYMTPYRPEPELSTAEVLRLLDELADAGCLRLLLTGGEPLLRPDFRAIWRHAKTRGFLLTLFTNATLADAETVAFLRDLPPTMCEVTLYGASADTYRRVCGDARAFDAALAGLERLRAALPHVGAKGMAMRANGDDMAALEALCDARGVEFSFDTDVFPRLDGDTDPLEHAYDAEEGVRRVLGSRLHREAWRRMNEEWRAVEWRADADEVHAESGADPEISPMAEAWSRSRAEARWNAREEDSPSLRLKPGAKRRALKRAKANSRTRTGLCPTMTEPVPSHPTPPLPASGEGAREPSPRLRGDRGGLEDDDRAQIGASVARPLRREGKVVVCRAGESSFHIGPYGDLCLCMLLREPHYDLRRGTFLAGWRTVIADLLRRERSTPARCAQCPDLRYCVPCAGRNRLETGSAEDLAPSLCRRSRAVARMFENEAQPAEPVAEEACRV